MSGSLAEPVSADDNAFLGKQINRIGLNPIHCLLWDKLKEDDYIFRKIATDRNVLNNDNALHLKKIPTPIIVCLYV